MPKQRLKTLVPEVNQNQLPMLERVIIDEIIQPKTNDQIDYLRQECRRGEFREAKQHQTECKLMIDRLKEFLYGSTDA